MIEGGVSHAVGGLHLHIGLHHLKRRLGGGGQAGHAGGGGDGRELTAGNLTLGMVVRHHRLPGCSSNEVRRRMSPSYVAR